MSLSRLARRLVCALSVAASLTVGARESSAQPQVPSPAATAPSPSHARARELFDRGNEALRASDVALAAAFYRRALLFRDHPNIHYNLALALVYVGEPDEVARELEKALAGGLPPAQTARAQSLRAPHGPAATAARTRSRHAHVELTVHEPDAELFFDERSVLIGPGTWRADVAAAVHSIRVVKADGVMHESRVTARAGTTLRRDLP